MMSASSKRVGWALVAAAAVLVAVGAFFVFNFDRSVNEKCTTFTAIANDAHKMQYVREWVAKRTSDKDFMEAVVEHRWFESFSPFTPRYIDIDWRYLGFDPDAAWVAFNVNHAEGSGPARILSISLNQRRAGIILKLNPTDDVVGDGPPGNKSTVKAVGDDVFVYCDFGD